MRKICRNSVADQPRYAIEVDKTRGFGKYSGNDVLKKWQRTEDETLLYDGLGWNGMSSLKDLLVLVE